MQKAFARFFGVAACGLIVLAFAAASAEAQFRAGLQGSVVDAGGGLVAGATVTLVSNETQRTLTVTTNDDGFYRFSSLAPGSYSLTVESANFKKQVYEDVAISGENIQGLDVTLSAGGIQEVVTVTDETPALETEDANIRKTITEEEILRLPQIGRDPYELARLAPGVFGDGARGGGGGSVGLPNTSGPGGSDTGIFATENRPAISANGQRVSANSFQVDGVDVNSQTWGGAAVITPTQESVKEVQVTSATYSAEDGRNSGAQVKVVTQNGTRAFRGSAFFKYNDPGWNAFNSGFTIRDDRFATPRVRQVLPVRVNNRDKIYGGSFGGPLPISILNFGEGGNVLNSLKDKLFFFFAYEGLRRFNNNPSDGWVETEQFRQFIINNRPNSIARRVVTSEGSNPRVLQVLNRTCADFVFPTGVCNLLPGGFDIGSPTLAQGTYVPATNLAGGGLDGIPDVQFVRFDNPVGTTGNQYVGRIDLEATQKDKFAWTLFYAPRFAQGNEVAAQSRPQAAIRSDRLNYNTALTYIRTITPNIVNEARINFTKWGFNEVESNPDINFGIPRIEIEQFLPGGARLRWGAARSGATPGTFDERTVNIKDTLTWVADNHALKFGFDYRKETNVNPGTGAARPIYTFQRWNFFNDTPLFEQINLDFAGRPVAQNADFSTGGFSFFGQDDWKIRPNLSINLGLRWEYYKSVEADTLGIFQLGPNGLPDSRITVGGSLVKPDYNNFGPQLGFAWTPGGIFGDGLVLRGGAGIGYDRLANALPANTRNNPPNGFNFSINGCSSTNPFCGGQLLYSLGATNSPTSFPVNPGLGQGFAANGGPRTGSVQVYGLDPNMRTPTIYRYSLEAQYQLPFNTVGTLGYQGSLSRNFVRIEPLHLTQSVPAPNFSPIFYGKGDVGGNYNGMNARLQKRLSSGVQVDFNYKFSKSLDSVSFEGPCACTNQTYPIDQSTEFGRSDYDVRHSFNLVGLWELPFYRRQQSLAGKLLGGWQINGILTRHTGFPWTPLVAVGLNTPNPGVTLSPTRPVSYNGTRPRSNSNENFLSAGGLFPGSVIFNAAGTGVVSCTTLIGCNSVFSTRTNGNVLANNPPGVGRNTFFGPKYFNVDMSLSKRIGLPNLGVLGEKPNFDIRFNFFNIFNLQNITPYDLNTGPTQLQSATFSEAGSLLAGRIVEMQLRFSF